MNLAGVLSPKVWISYFLLTGFLLFPASAQTTQQKNPVEQTSFSIEFPFEQPVLVSEAAKKAISSDRAIANVMKDGQLSIERIPKNWFTASQVHLGSKSETDLVVMGTGISLGPYSAGFWILRQIPQGYEIVLAVNTHDLALLDTRTNGLRDIETGLPTGGKDIATSIDLTVIDIRKALQHRKNQPSKNPDQCQHSDCLPCMPAHNHSRAHLSQFIRLTLLSGTLQAFVRLFGGWSILIFLRFI